MEKTAQGRPCHPYEIALTPLWTASSPLWKPGLCIWKQSHLEMSAFALDWTGFGLREFGPALRSPFMREVGPALRSPFMREVGSRSATGATNIAVVVLDDVVHAAVAEGHVPRADCMRRVGRRRPEIIRRRAREKFFVNGWVFIPVVHYAFQLFYIRQVPARVL